jgi:1,2-dihydroxy-3-keto-5-methylthiopentene dioxygenase
MAMAVLTIPDDDRVLTDAEAIRACLAEHGIWYRTFAGAGALPPDATHDAILAVHAEPIAALRQEGGYQTADVIDVTPEAPGLDAMLAKFAREHWHDEDEVRLIVAGRGLFHLHPDSAPVLGVEVVAGDMIKVPRRMRHWFHLCEERTIRAVRLFIDPAGWVPHYTDSGLDALYQPLCFSEAPGGR